MMKLSLIVLIALIFITPSYACSDPPSDYFLYPEGLLRKASSVVLVKVLSKEVIPAPKTVPWPTFEKIQVKVLENLAGSERKTPLILKGIISDRGSNHFNNHEDHSFWASPMIASGGTIGDCYAYGVFDEGKTYLVFLGVGNTKAFEEIDDIKNDRWLAMVRELINGKKTRNKNKN